MNMKELNLIAKEIKKEEAVINTTKYDFNKCKRIQDIPDGIYNAYVEKLILSYKMATIRLYLKTNDEGVLLNYNIGAKENAWTIQHTTDIQLQIKTDKEFIRDYSNRWGDYITIFNEALFQGVSEEIAKADFLNSLPKWYEEGIYENVGNIIIKASHSKDNNRKLQLGFSEYLINKATK